MSEISRNIMLYILIFLAILAIYYLQKNGKSKHFMDLAKQIKGPRGLPVFGNALSMSRFPGGVLNYIYDSVKKFGTVTRIWVGSNFYVFLTDPKDIEIILRDTQNLRKSKSYDFLKPWLKEGLVTSTGLHWHTHRKVLTPAFHFNILDKFVGIFNEKSKTLNKLLKGKTDAEAFDICPFINLYALDAIMETSMGIKINAEKETKSEYLQALKRFKEIVTKRTYNPTIHSNMIFYLTPLGREHQKQLKIINNTCNKIIKERKEELKNAAIEDIENTDNLGIKKRTAFLDLLLLGQKAGNGFTDDDILDEVNTIMFGGQDTTSTAISFAVFCLAENQDIQQKAYEEIVELYGTELHDKSIQDLNRTQYLDMVIKETLRIFPPIPLISRLLETDVKLTNHTIPAGTSINFFPYGTHRNEEHYTNPLVFDPERFSVENIKARHPYAFIPFSAGPRNCIGQKYAMFEMKLAIIELLQNFKIFPGKKLGNVQTNLVLTPMNGIFIRLENRIS